MEVDIPDKLLWRIFGVKIAFASSSSGKAVRFQGKVDGRTCNKCGSPTHFARDCPLQSRIGNEKRNILITAEIDRRVEARLEAERAAAQTSIAKQETQAQAQQPDAPPVALTTAAQGVRAAAPIVNYINSAYQRANGTALVIDRTAGLRAVYHALVTGALVTTRARASGTSQLQDAGDHPETQDGGVAAGASTPLTHEDPGDCEAGARADSSEDDDWYYFEPGDVVKVPATGDITETGIDPGATYLHWYDKDEPDPRFRVGGSGQEFRPGGMHTWGVGGRGTNPDDAMAKIRAPIMTALSASIAAEDTVAAARSAEFDLLPELGGDPMLEALQTVMQCDDSKEYCNVRAIMTHLHYTQLDNRSVEKFVEQYTMVVDGGANTGLVNNAEFLDAKTISRGNFSIGTINGTAACTAAGMTDVWLLTSDYADEQEVNSDRPLDMVQCPAQPAVLQPNSKYSVLALETLMGYPNVDGCLHPPKAGDVRRFISIDNRDVLLVAWQGLWRVVVVTQDRLIRSTKNNILLSVRNMSSKDAEVLRDLTEQGSEMREKVEHQINKCRAAESERGKQSTNLPPGDHLLHANITVVDPGGDGQTKVEHPTLSWETVNNPDGDPNTLRWKLVYNPDHESARDTCATLLAESVDTTHFFDQVATDDTLELTAQDYAAILMSHAKRKYSLDEWHLVLNHASEKIIRRTLDAAGIEYRGASDSLSHCGTCAAAKLKRSSTSTHVHGYRAKYPVRGPASVIAHDAAYFVNETISGARRYLVCTCLYSGYSVGSVLVDTKEHYYNVANVLPRLIAEIRTMANHSGGTAVYADAAPENMSEDLLAALQNCGHPVCYASPHTKSRTNPNVESRISYTRACTRAYLIHAGAPPFLAGAAALDALEKRNDLVGEDGLTPRQKITGDHKTKPRFDHWHKFGELVYVFDNDQQDKTMARAIAAVYIGLGALVRKPGITAYIPSSHRIVSTLDYLVVPDVYPFRQGLVEALISDRCSNARYGYLPDGTTLESLVGRKVDRAMLYGGEDEKEAYHYIGKIKKLLPPPADPTNLNNWLFEVEFEDHKVQVKSGKNKGQDKKFTEKLNYGEIREILVEHEHILTCDQLETLLLLNEKRSTADILATFDMTQATASKPTAASGPADRRELPEGFHTGRISLDAAISFAESINDQDLLREIIQARDKEINNLMSIPALEWTHRQPGDKLSKIKLLIKLKQAIDTHGHKMKCRGVHCMPKFLMDIPDGGWDASAHTISYPDLLFAINLALGLDLDFCQLDAVCAYLQADAPRERMVYEPPKFLKPPSPGMILRAKRALYGHPESGRAWMLLWQSQLKKLGFQRVDRAGTWQIRADERGIIMICTIVDDSMIMYDNKATLDEFVSSLKEHIQCDVTPLSTFVGISFHHDKANRRMVMHQRPLIEAICKRFGVNEDCKDPVTPLPERYNVDTKDCPEVVDKERSTLIRQIIGSFSFVSNTRPGIKLAVSMLSRVAHNPSAEHLHMAIRVLRYLWHSRHIPLVFTAKPWRGPDGYLFPVNMPGGFPDSSLGEGGIDVQRRSRCGYAFLMNGGCFAARTTIATGVSTSSAMAEVKGLHYCVTEAMAIIQTFIQLKMTLKQAVPIFEDNQACINIMTISSNASSSRHIEVKYFYCQELMERGLIDLRKIATEFELGDGFTKALPAHTYLAHRDHLQGLSQYSQEERAALYARVAM